jgi:hypothetical protein
MVRAVIFAIALRLSYGCQVQQFTPVVSPNDQGEIGGHLAALQTSLQAARKSALDATQASSLAALKHYVDEVFAAVWGHGSELTVGSGAVRQLGWRERWQTSYTHFDAAFVERYGRAPAQVTDPAELGVLGRERYARHQILSQLNTHENSSHGRLLAGLNNVIGWQRLDDGVTKAERQPRIDLTYLWDAEQDFWRSEADTGWLFTVAAQAINILKTDYDNDLTLAQTHARSLILLLDRCINDVDTNNNGRIDPIPGEAGIETAMD